MHPSLRPPPLLLAGIVFVLGTATAPAGEEVWRLEQFWTGPKKPLVDMTYGTGWVRHRLFQGNFNGVGTVEVRLGYSKAFPQQSNVVDLSDKFFFFNYTASDLFGRTPDQAKVTTEIVRFGYGGSRGFAYDFTTSYLYPYSQTTVRWTRLSSGRPAGLSLQDAEVLDRYEDAFRFGTSAEAGVALGFAQVFTAHAGYEVSAVYPRHVFWQWVGSYGLAMVGMSAVSHFGEEIVEISPDVGPVVYTLLRGGLAYGYYLLVRDNQYWPFKSETPLTTDGFRFGITLTF